MILNLVVSNGLMFVSAVNHESRDLQSLVYNPITKECIKLPQLSDPYLYTNCYQQESAFIKHDLQSSTYKILFISNLDGYIYKSSSHIWQRLNSFCNFISNLQHQVCLYSPYSCTTYKNNIYVVFCTSEGKLMIAIYDLKTDAWNNLDLNVENDEYLYLSRGEGKLIIANGCLFFPRVSFILNDCFILISELKIEDRLLIPIIKIKPQVHCISFGSIFGFGNKIIIH